MSQIGLNEMVSDELPVARAIPSADAVAEYLKHHPDFFYKYPELVESLYVPHPKSGKSISLLERQIWQLRVKNQQMQTDLGEFLTNAKANVEIAQKVQDFALDLMQTMTVEEAVDIILYSMKHYFSVDHVMMHSFEMPMHQVSGISQLGVSSAWTEAMKMALAPGKPHCGLVEADWRKGLFPKIETVESVCIIPLGTKKIWGILALGSNDQRFEPHDTYFLKFICQFVTAKLEILFSQ